MRPNTAPVGRRTPPAVANEFGKQVFAKEGEGGQMEGKGAKTTTRDTHAWGCGTLTMEPLMLPMKTMLPFALRSMRWRATAVAKR